METFDRSLVRAIEGFLLCRVLSGRCSYGRNIERAAGSGSTGPLNYSANIERNQADGYRERSAYMTWGGGANLGYDINARNNLGLQVDYDTIAYQSPGYESDHAN